MTELVTVVVEAVRVLDQVRDPDRRKLGIPLRRERVYMRLYKGIQGIMFPKFGYIPPRENQEDDLETGLV